MGPKLPQNHLGAACYANSLTTEADCFTMSTPLDTCELAPSDAMDMGQNDNRVTMMPLPSLENITPDDLTPLNSKDRQQLVDQAMGVLTALAVCNTDAGKEIIMDHFPTLKECVTSPPVDYLPPTIPICIPVANQVDTQSEWGIEWIPHVYINPSTRNNLVCKSLEEFLEKVDEALLLNVPETELSNLLQNYATQTLAYYRVRPIRALLLVTIFVGYDHKCSDFHEIWRLVKLARRLRQPLPIVNIVAHALVKNG